MKYIIKKLRRVYSNGFVPYVLFTFNWSFYFNIEHIFSFVSRFPLTFVRHESREFVEVLRRRGVIRFGVVRVKTPYFWKVSRNIWGRYFGSFEETSVFTLF